MQLIKKEFINASKLSGREYLVSLLREAQKSGLVLPESAVRIRKEGMDIVADLAMDFTDGLSSSIRIEQAQEFVLSVFYTAGLALKACPSPDEAAFRLASEPLRTLYDEGTKIIKKKLVTARMLHGQVSKIFLPLKTSSMPRLSLTVFVVSLNSTIRNSAHTKRTSPQIIRLFCL